MEESKVLTMEVSMRTLLSLVALAAILFVTADAEARCGGRERIFKGRSGGCGASAQSAPAAPVRSIRGGCANGTCR